VRPEALLAAWRVAVDAPAMLLHHTGIIPGLPASRAGLSAPPASRTTASRAPGVARPRLRQTRTVRAGRLIPSHPAQERAHQLGFEHPRFSGVLVVVRNLLQGSSSC